MFPPRVAKLRDAVRAIGGGPARLAGNAATLMAEEAQRGGGEFDASEAAPYPDIVAIARMGAVADPETSPARPLYIKAPDAHPSSATQSPASKAKRAKRWLSGNEAYALAPEAAADRNAEECAPIHAAAFAHPWSAEEIASLLASGSTIGSAALDPGKFACAASRFLAWRRTRRKY